LILLMTKVKFFKLKLIFPPMLDIQNQYSRNTYPYIPYGTGVLTDFLRKHNYEV